EILRFVPRRGVDRGPRDIEDRIRDDIRTTIAGFADTGKYSAEHVDGNIDPRRLTGKTDLCRFGINSPGTLEDLDHGKVFRDVKNLPGPFLAVFQEDPDPLPEGCPFHIADKDKGAGDIRNRPVIPGDKGGLLHFSTSRAARPVLISPIIFLRSSVFPRSFIRPMPVLIGRPWICLSVTPRFIASFICA